MTRLPLIVAAALLPLASAAFAQTATPTPPAEPMLPLSQILSRIEAESDFVNFDDIEWNARSSSWEISYKGTGGKTVSVEIAGATGEPVEE